MKSFKFILSMLLIVLIAVSTLSSCDNGETGATDITSAPTAEITPQDIGQGETTFRLEVIHSFESTTVWNVSTDKDTVGAALLELGFIDSDSFITVVNGLKADYAEDGYWWSFTIDGEWAFTGISETEINEDKIYAFVHSEA